MLPRRNHKTEDCYHPNKPKCTICKKLGHKEDQIPFPEENEEASQAEGEAGGGRDCFEEEVNVAEAVSDDEKTLAAIGGDHHMLPDDPFVDDVYAPIGSAFLSGHLRSPRT